MKVYWAAGACFVLSACDPGHPSVQLNGIPEPSVPPVRHVQPRAIPRPSPTPFVTRTEKASEQLSRWKSAKLKPSFQITLDKKAMLYERTKGRYEVVERMRSNGVPAPVIFALHSRESDNSFRAHLHEGSSLLGRTKYVPKGRPLPPAQPPFTWEESAEDAIYSADKLQGPWDTVAWSLNKIEGYNGLGYRKRGIPSPYLWSGTDQYRAGKYTSDGHFSTTAIDQQLGVVAILKRLQERGVVIKFDP